MTRLIYRSQRPLFVSLFGVFAALFAPASALPTEPAKIVLRGRIVCLAEEMHKLHKTDLPTKHAHLYGFKTLSGNYYTFLRTKYSQALFEDKRLHTKELILTGRALPNAGIFDASGKMQSVHKGVIHDLYYFCEVCVIKTIVSGPCMCCQEEVIMVEKPMAKQDARGSDRSR